MKYTSSLPPRTSLECSLSFSLGYTLQVNAIRSTAATLHEDYPVQIESDELTVDVFVWCIMCWKLLYVESFVTLASPCFLPNMRLSLLQGSANNQCCRAFLMQACGKRILLLSCALYTPPPIKDFLCHMSRYILRLPVLLLEKKNGKKMYIVFSHSTVYSLSSVSSAVSTAGILLP